MNSINLFGIAQLSPTHVAEIALIATMLVLLGLAPRIEKSTLAVTIIGFIGAAVLVACGVMADGNARYAMITAGVALIPALLLLESAEMFDEKQRPEAAALFNVGAIGAIVLATAANLLEVALGVELLSLAGALLIALGRGMLSLEASFKYFLLTAMTFAMFLFGMALCFVATGSLDLTSALATTGEAKSLVLVGAALMIMGLSFKLALMPVHFGALDAYTMGPSSFVGFIMVTSKLGAAVGLAKIAASAGTQIQVLLMALALFTIGFSVVASFAQTDLRRLLAYSAVAHAGFIALGAASSGGLEIAKFYVLSYGVAALLAFAALASTGTEGFLVNRLGTETFGRVRALALLLSLMSLAGVPPLPGFWAKMAVLVAAYKTFGTVACVIAALGGVVSIIYYLRPMPDLLAHVNAAGVKLKGTQLVAIVLLVAGVVFLTVAPGYGFWLAR